MTVWWPGIPLALGSAFLFGLSAPVAKMLLVEIDPSVLAGILYLGAGVGLACFTLLRRSLGLPVTEAPLRRGDLPWLAAVIVFGGVFGPLLLMLGLSMTSAASGSLLLNLESIFTLAIAWLVFRENVDRRLLVGAAAIIAGAVLLTWSGGAIRVDMGALLIAAACLSWGIDNNLTRRLSSADPVQIAMIKGLVAGSANLALGLAAGGSLPRTGYALGGATLGLFSIGLSLVFFMYALRHLGTARTGAYYALAPFVGAVVAVMILGESITPALAAAGILMGIGLWLHLSERHDHEHVHEAMEHEHLHVHDEHHQHDHDGPFTEPHSHWHRHETLRHAHAHYPDLHHRHEHT